MTIDKTLYAVLLMAMVNCRLAKAEDTQIQSLPRVKSYRLVPVDYKVPYTRLGLDKELAGNLYPRKEYRGGPILLKDDELLEIWSDQIAELDADLKIYAPIPNERLNRLILHFNRLPKGGYHELKRFTNLKLLSVMTDDVDVDALITNCPKLEMLELASSNVRIDGSQGEAFSDGTLKKINRWKNLKAFRIHGKKITDEGVAALKLTDLEAVELIRTERVSDDGLKSLTAIKSLQEIGIQLNPGMTKKGLEELASLPKLQLLVIYGGKALSPSQLESLKAAMPNVKIKVEN